MSEHQESDLKHVKFLIVGGEKVGKTYLAHKAADRQYLGYVPTTQCQKYLKNSGQKHQILTYYDLPPLRLRLAEEIPNQDKLDVMVCIFKDSTSFGKLYEFFQQITIKSDEDNKDFNQYWQSIKLFVLVYSDYQQKGKVQIDQLFNILSQEIRNFNTSSAIKQFLLKIHLSNYQQLQDIISNVKLVGQANQDMAASQRQAQKDLEQIQKRPKLAKIKKLQYSKEGSIIKNRDFSASFYVQPWAPQRNEQANDQNHQYAQITEVKEAAPKSQQQSYLVGNQSLQQKKKQHSGEIILKNIEPQTHNNENNPKNLQSTLNFDFFNIQIQQKRDNQTGIIKADITQKKNTQNQEEQHDKKQEDHYQKFVDKLLQRIFNQQLKPSKKNSYENLSEQFSKISKIDFNVSQKMRQDWQKKLEKLQEQQPPELQLNKLQNKPLVLQEDRLNQTEQELYKLQTSPRGQYLPAIKPNQLQVGTKKIQKQPGKDGQTCACIIM